MAGRGARVSYPRKWRKKVQAPNFPAGNGDSFAPCEPHVSIHTFLTTRFLDTTASRCAVLAGRAETPAGLEAVRDTAETCWPDGGPGASGPESGFCLDGDAIAVFTSYVRPPGPATVSARLSAWLEDEGRRPRRLKAQALSPLRGQFCGHGTGGPPAHLPEQRKRAVQSRLEADAHRQHWKSGARMETSSWECRPNLRERQTDCARGPPPPRGQLRSPAVQAHLADHPLTAGSFVEVNVLLREGSAAGRGEGLISHLPARKRASGLRWLLCP